MVHLCQRGFIDRLHRVGTEEKGTDCTPSGVWQLEFCAGDYFDRSCRHFPLQCDHIDTALSADAHGISRASERFSSEHSGIGSPPNNADHRVLTSRVDFRKLIGIGFFLVAFSLWLISGLTLDISTWHIAMPSFFTGVGLSMIFVPLATVAMGTLAQKEMGNASGVFNLVRNVGGSVGIALLTTYVVRSSQANQTILVSPLTSWDPGYQQRLQETQSYLSSRLGPAEHCTRLSASSMILSLNSPKFLRLFRTSECLRLSV